MGWRRIGGVAGDADIFEVDVTREDYPEQFRSRENATDVAKLESNSAVQNSVSLLRNKYQKIDMRLVREALHVGVERQKFLGDDTMSNLANGLIMSIRQIVRHEAEALGPIASLDGRVRYLAEHAIPVELVPFVADEVPEPAKIITNADPDRTAIFPLGPGQTVVIFEKTTKTAITATMGKFIGEALKIQNAAEGRPGPRPQMRTEDPDKHKQCVWIAIRKERDRADWQVIAKELHWCPSDRKWTPTERSTIKKMLQRYRDDGVALCTWLYGTPNPQEWPDPDITVQSVVTTSS